MGRSPRTESNSRQESTSNKASQGASKLNASNMPLKVDLADDLARVQGQFSPSPSPSRRGILKDLSDEDAPAEDAPATPTFSLHRVRSNVDVLYYHALPASVGDTPERMTIATEPTGVPPQEAGGSGTFSLHRVRSNVDVLYYHDQTNAEASEPADASLATEPEEEEPLKLDRLGRPLNFGNYVNGRLRTVVAPAAPDLASLL